METSSKASKIVLGIMYIIGGVVLIATDSRFDLEIYGVIPIPFALSILGIVSISLGIGNIFDNKISKKRLLINKRRKRRSGRNIQSENKIAVSPISPKITPSQTPVKKILTGHRDWITCSHCDAKQPKSSVVCTNCRSEFEK
jgi:hypothetical protein